MPRRDPDNPLIRVPLPDRAALPPAECGVPSVEFVIPRTAMVICDSDSRHTFRVYLPEATHVELVGSFTDWRARPIPMKRESTGWWSASLALNPGDHDFSYLVNGATWLADYAAMGVRRNGYGGWVSQIAVPHSAPHTPTVQFPRRASSRAA